MIDGLENVLIRLSQGHNLDYSSVIILPLEYINEVFGD